MAELTTLDRKSRLIGELARTRIALSQNWSAVRSEANVGRKVKGSFQLHKGAWLGGAAVMGWILSRLPTRRKKVEVYVEPSQRRVKVVKKAGVLLGIARILLPLLKPTVMAWVTAKITEAAARKGKFNKPPK